jgi:hypothetical protein
MSRINRFWSKLRVAGLFAAALGASLGLAPREWRKLHGEPAGLAPDPATTPEAVVQVYGARVSGWRGIFGVHTWVAAKPSNAEHYTIYEVISWRLRWADSSVAIGRRKPDGHWYGARPHLLADVRGGHVDGLISRVDQIARSYHYSRHYSAWPGPNSNTFVATIARAVPELEVEFPSTAIGKDYLGSSVFGCAPSGCGLQFSMLGLLGVTIGRLEGIEINVLALTFGLNLLTRTLKLPIVGNIDLARLGLRRGAVRSLTRTVSASAVAAVETVAETAVAAGTVAAETVAAVQQLSSAQAETNPAPLRRAA